MQRTPQVIRTCLCLSTFCMLIAAVCPAAQSPNAIQRVQQLLQAGNTSAAQTLLTEALRETPDNGGLYDLQGVIEAQQGDFASAEASFRKAIELSPHLQGAYLNLGHLYQEQTRADPRAREKALSVYAELLRFAPDNTEANYQSALLLMKKGLYTASLRCLSRLPAEAQERSQTLSLLCGNNAGLGQVDKAEQAADQMLQNADLAEEDVTTILPILASRKDATLASKLVEGLESRHLATFASWRSLGLLEKDAGRLEAARKALETSAQLQPNSVPTLIDLARVADDQKDYAGALGYLAHARDLEPNNASIHFFWGIVCIKQNLAEEAYNSLKKATALDPNNAYYNYAMGVVTMERTNASEAIPYLQIYCQLKPNDVRGRLALGVAYYNSLENEDAEKVISPIANNPLVLAGANYYLGRIANREGRYSEALQHLRVALRARPDYADAFAEIGLMYFKQKDYPKAKEVLEKALKLNPRNYAANLNLTMLYQRTKDQKAAAQMKRFEQLKADRALQEREFSRTIEVRP